MRHLHLLQYFVMEDSLSVKSNESIATSEEFDFVSDKPGTSKTPTLELCNCSDLNQLKEALTEVLKEPEMDVNETDGTKKVGHSLFYGCPIAPGTDPLSVEAQVSPTEKQDSSESNSSDESEGGCLYKSLDVFCTVLLVLDWGYGYTMFGGVTYLGAAAINAPKSEGEIQRNMAILNEQSFGQGIKISVYVPSCSEGLVK